MNIKWDKATNLVADLYVALAATITKQKGTFAVLVEAEMFGLVIGSSSVLV